MHGEMPVPEFLLSLHLISGNNSNLYGHLIKFLDTGYNNRMYPYPVPAQEIRCKLTVSNSHFISSLAPVFTVDEAKAFIARIKTEFADASHNVPVYLIGHGDSEIAHCTDAGEPSGTAGRPALAVLRGSGLGDVAVVVTRYFGGTKLGTGGLVRAYSEAVRLVVESVPRAEKVHTHTVMLAFAYNYLERVRIQVAAQEGEILDEKFAADVTMTARLRVEKLPCFQASLSELTNGKVQAEVIESKDVLMPLAP
jgi:uncharacterized YigZ family protein